MSDMLYAAEEGFTAKIACADQSRWTDAENGFTRRVVSMRAIGLKGEVIEGVLEAGRRITYDTSPTPGLEHHLVMVSGRDRHRRRRVSFTVA